MPTDPQPYYTLEDFIQDFPDDIACLEWLKKTRWADGIHCQTCGKITSHYLIISRKSYACQSCGHHVHPTADTIFHKSSTPLTTWFYVIYLMVMTQSKISAKDVQRQANVTYKTAWRMHYSIRTRLNEGQSLFGDELDPALLRST